MKLSAWVRNEDGVVRAGWKIGFFAIFLIVGTLISAALLRHLQPLVPRALIPGNAAVSFGAIIATWGCLFVERKPLASIGAKFDQRFLRHWLLGLLFGAALLGSVALGVWLCGGFYLLALPKTPVPMLQSFWLFLIGAIFEELTFRGYPFQRAIEAIGMLRCQIVFAVLFVLAHLGSPALRHGAVFLPLLTIFLAAVLLGYCYWVTRSLALPLGVHMGWNWLQETLGFSVSGRDFAGLWHPVLAPSQDWLTGGTFGLEGSVVSPIVLICAFVTLFLWKRRSETT